MSKKLYSFLVLSAFGVLSLGGCELAKNQLKIDRASDMELQDFRDALAPREVELPTDKEVAASGVPPLMPYISPVSDDIKSMPLVSVSVNQTVPLRDVLYELAAQADYDIELDPRIRGSIIFVARNRPFDVVVKRIADIAGLRCKFDEDVLRVELDTPYNEIYKIDYVNLIRTSSGEIRNDIAVVSGEGADTGSRFSAGNESESDFWGELEVGLSQILGGSQSVHSLKTRVDPRITVAEDTSAPVGTTMPVGDGADTSAPPPENTRAVLKVDSLPVDGDDDEGEDEEDGDAALTGNFAINRQAGLISVYANEKQQFQVAGYLEKLHRAVTSQVLIEAKVLEVSLSDEFATGIDWGSNSLLSDEMSIGLDVVSDSGIRPLLDPIVDPASDFVMSYIGNDFSAGIQAISRFGTVRALASPRLTVLNNQAAVLNVADNQVYFKLDLDVSYDDDNNRQVEVDSEIKNVPEGVLINVLPSIDVESGNISLAVRPTITRIIEYVSDPGIAFIASSNNLDDVVSQIPVVNVQEMDSIIQMHSGQAIVMGGLMQDRYQSEENAVPVLGEIPVFGGLFRSQVDSLTKTELVVFLKATILENGRNNIHNTDKDVYKTFSQDRRPFKM